MKLLDEIINDMKVRAEKFSGLSDNDKQRYMELATQFPKIFEPLDGNFLIWVEIWLKIEEIFLTLKLISFNQFLTPNFKMSTMNITGE